MVETCSMHGGLRKISTALVREELYRPSDRRLKAKLVQTFWYRGFRVVSATDPYA
jgi:SOS response regulatory protein OraA/RecX